MVLKGSDLRTSSTRLSESEQKVLQTYLTRKVELSSLIKFLQLSETASQQVFGASALTVIKWNWKQVIESENFQWAASFHWGETCYPLKILRLDNLQWKDIWSTWHLWLCRQHFQHTLGGGCQFHKRPSCHAENAFESKICGSQPMYHYLEPLTLWEWKVVWSLQPKTSAGWFFLVKIVGFSDIKKKS